MASASHVDVKNLAGGVPGLSAAAAAIRENRLSVDRYMAACLRRIASEEDRVRDFTACDRGIGGLLRHLWTETDTRCDPGLGACSLLSRHWSPSVSMFGKPWTLHWSRSFFSDTSIWLIGAT